MLLSKLLFLVVAILSVSAVSAAPKESDPCLAEDYAELNYATCCAGGGYKIEGHGEICKVVGPKIKAKKEL
ncbi:hypothetical protein Ctob_000203 [Chrysochromulina tobinii]|uniref:Uncharacterized protein n=1 Tax=Chrysochromulina tobinii TaxID=1460289 RepID=A0A0M0J9R2_9EUKA|nr:hypothetical protein Ctob_000203 [Chrysochromulina tobinii]|eukprot:KOO23311.1 hypothetical protein Ctob_000203 [Chrysochromulina sp. CCMP291]